MKLKKLDELAEWLYKKIYRDLVEEYADEPEEERLEYNELLTETQRALKNAIMWLKDQPQEALSQSLFPEFYARIWSDDNHESKKLRQKALANPEGIVEDVGIWYETISELREYFASTVPR